VAFWLWGDEVRTEGTLLGFETRSPAWFLDSEVQTSLSNGPAAGRAVGGRGRLGRPKKRQDGTIFGRRGFPGEATGGQPTNPCRAAGGPGAIVVNGNAGMERGTETPTPGRSIASIGAAARGVFTATSFAIAGTPAGLAHRRRMRGSVGCRARCRGFDSEPHGGGDAAASAPGPDTCGVAWTRPLMTRRSLPEWVRGTSTGGGGGGPAPPFVGYRGRTPRASPAWDARRCRHI